MPLWKFKNNNKYGNLRTRIIHTDTPTLNINPKGLGPTIIVSRFHYEHEHLYAPALIDRGGKRYILPTWKEVHPKTTLNDIKHIKPTKPSEKVKEKNTWEVKSSSGNGVYVIKQVGVKFTCNCSGYWRLKDKNKGCKHIREVKTKMK